MRTVLLLLGATAALLAQPTISNVRVDDIGHSSARITWDSSPAAACSGGGKWGQRVRYGPTSGYGTTQHTYQCVPVANDQQITIQGLACNTEYHYSVGSSDTGADSNWGNSSDATFQTLACPSPHPALPIAPVEVAIGMPTQTGTTHNVASDCSDLQAKLNAATCGDTVRIPAGTVCTGTYSLPHGCGNKQATVNTSTDEWTVTSHGYSNGQQILVGGDFGTPWPVFSGQIVFVRDAAANTFKVARTSGGAAIDMLTAGSGVRVVAWPLPDSWIVVESTGTIPPSGVRTGPGWESQMATIRVPASKAGVNEVYSAAIHTSDPGSGAFGTLAHHYRFVGIAFGHENYATAGATTDPKPFYGLIQTSPDDSFFIFDRCSFVARGYPDRLVRLSYTWDGRNMAVIDSYANNIDYWRTWKTGLSLSVGGAGNTVLTIAAGTYNLGNTSCTLASPVTATITAGASGTAYVSMPTSCTPRITALTGTTTTGSGFTLATSGSPAFPRNGANELTEGLIGTVATAATPAWSSPVNTQEYETSAYNTEGSAGLFTQHGPGPALVQNNHIEGTGTALLYTSDDNKIACPSAPCSSDQVTTNVPSDIVARGNTFKTGFNRMPGHALSDGRNYGHRGQHVEFKQGVRILMEGNWFLENYKQNTPAGYAALLSCNASFMVGQPVAECSDVAFRKNFVLDSSGGFQINGGPPSSYVRPKNTRRVAVEHNVLHRINGGLASAVDGGGASGGVPLAISNGGGEDVLIGNNTVRDVKGTCSHSLRVQTLPIEGFVARNNILEYPDDSNCGGFTFVSATDTLTRHKAAMDANLTSGPGNTAYTWTNNTLLPTWTNSIAQTGTVDASAVASAYAASPATYVRTESTVAERIDALKFLDAASNNLRLRHNSAAFRLGDDGRNQGADVEAVERALGTVRGVSDRLSGATTFDIAWTPPSAFNCSVELSSNNFSTSTRLTATQGDARQSVQFTSLSAATAYRWRLLCAIGIQAELTGGFRTP